MPVETKCSYQIFVQVLGLKFESKDREKPQETNYGEQVFFWKQAQKCCVLS